MKIHFVELAPRIFSWLPFHLEVSRGFQPKLCAYQMHRPRKSDRSRQGKGCHLKTGKKHKFLRQGTAIQTLIDAVVKMYLWTQQGCESREHPSQSSICGPWCGKEWTSIARQDFRLLASPRGRLFGSGQRSARLLRRCSNRSPAPTFFGFPPRGPWKKNKPKKRGVHKHWHKQKLLPVSPVVMSRQNGR